MPHIEDITVRNYRVLQNVTFKDLRPLTVVSPHGTTRIPQKNTPWLCAPYEQFVP